MDDYPTVNSEPLWGNHLELVEHPPGKQARPLPEAVQLPSELLGPVPARRVSEVLGQANTKPDSICAL